MATSEPKALTPLHPYNPKAAYIITRHTMSPPLARAWVRLARLAAVLGGSGSTAGAGSQQPAAARRLAFSSSSSSVAAAACAFDPQEWRPFVLQRSTPVSHDTKLLRFALPSPNHTTGLPLASCIMVQGAPDDIDTATSHPVARPYTPVSSPGMQGAFELLIKSYPKGRVSSYLHARREGDRVLIKGPFPKLAYTPNMTKRILMLAGGTGIAPMVQVLHRVLDPATGDGTRVTLLFGSRTRGDILMKEWLEAKARESQGRFTVVHVVEESDGFINADRIDKYFPRGADASAKDAMVLVCGPPPLMNALSGDKLPDKSQGPLTGALAALGWTPEQVYKF